MSTYKCPVARSCREKKNRPLEYRLCVCNMKYETCTKYQTKLKSNSSPKTK